MPYPATKLALLSGLLAATACSIPAQARTTIDCPQRAERYSIDSPMMDILVNPRALEVIESQAPGMVAGFPKAFMGPTAPNFSAILSMRELAGMTHLSEEKLSRINAGLAAIPVTAADEAARCARYEADAPRIAAAPGSKPRILLFDKSTGFRDGPSVDAARVALRALADRKGWSLTLTESAGAMTRQSLAQFDVVIWSNVSGDVLTTPQRRAFRSYIENGGGFIGIHGSSGDPVTFWPWYTDTLIGARFAGHTLTPQFQEAAVVVDDPQSGVVRALAPSWRMTDEWYSFKNNPRHSGAHVLLRLDEASYNPGEFVGKSLAMGADHPIAWTRCVGSGRSFYSAIGHVPAAYSQPQHVALLESAIAWAAGEGETVCKNGREVKGPAASRR